MPKNMIANRLLTTRDSLGRDAYQKHEKRFGEPPSVRQLARALGMSVNGAHRLIKRLIEKGYVSARPVTVIRPRSLAKGKKKP